MKLLLKHKEKKYQGISRGKNKATLTLFSDFSPVQIAWTWKTYVANFFQVAIDAAICSQRWLTLVSGALNYANQKNVPIIIHYFNVSMETSIPQSISVAIRWH